MKNGKERRLYRISMVITAMMFIGIFCPWLVYRNKTYTIIGFYCAVKNAGGISSFAGSDSFIYPAVITLTVPFAAGIVAGIKFLIQAFRGRIGIISWTVYSLEWVYMALYFSFEGYQPTIFAIGGPVLALADFLVNRFMEEYRLLTRKKSRTKGKGTARKKGTERTVIFPGKIFMENAVVDVGICGWWEKKQSPYSVNRKCCNSIYFFGIGVKTNNAGNSFGGGAASWKRFGSRLEIRIGYCLRFGYDGNRTCRISRIVRKKLFR